MQHFAYQLCTGPCSSNSGHCSRARWNAPVTCPPLSPPFCAGREPSEAATTASAVNALRPVRGRDPASQDAAGWAGKTLLARSFRWGDRCMHVARVDVADDSGYPLHGEAATYRLYGGRVSTLALQRQMARFSQAHQLPSCTPTLAALESVHCVWYRSDRCVGRGERKCGLITSTA